MNGRVVYTVHDIKPAERQEIELCMKQSGHRIFWQQFCDGFPSFRHYGVDLGDGTVVHFRGKIQYIHADAWIQRTDRAEFCREGRMFAAPEVRYRFPPDEVAQRALKQVGCNFGGYHFMTNNCEHFANWCACGHRISRQVMFR